MYRVMVDLWSNDFSDYITAEYSGIYHATQEAAEAELYDIKLHDVDNEALKNAYIQEF